MSGAGAGVYQGRFMSIRWGGDPPAARIEAAKRVVDAPFASNRGPETLRIVRFGAGGLSDQFGAQQEESLRGIRPWPRSKPFGKRPAPRSTLAGSGVLRSAWLGLNQHGYDRVTRDGLEIGVQGLPYAATFQRPDGPDTVTTVRPKKRAKDGRWAMFWYLALTFGVYLKAKTLENGLAIRQRRLGIGARVRKTVGAMLAEEVGAALAGKPSTLKGSRR